MADPVEPIVIADVEKHCRIGSGQIATLGETDTVNIYIASVREKAESITRRKLITASLTLTLDGFPSGREPIEIPRPPLQSITSIKYYDTDGVQQTLSSALYRVIAETIPNCQPGIVLPVYGEVWPSTRDDLAVVTITYSAGYGAAGSAVPASIRNWMLINIANLWENRESIVISKGAVIDLSKTMADGLLDDYRIYRW